MTPNLDALAASGVRFELATTVNNNTLPSHAAMLIGRYPQQFGVPRNGFRLPAGVETLTTRLAAEGFSTAAFVSASPLESGLGLERGFDLYDDAFDTAELDQDQRRAASTVDRAVAWLESRPAGPFFLWIHLFDPHYPYTPPAPFDELFSPEYEGDADGSIEYLSGIAGVRGYPKHPTSQSDLRKVIALYDGEIAYMDHHLGRLLAVLDRPDLHRSTAVIAIADHGESLTEHDYYFDHGEYVYQPSMRVPFLVRPPGRWPEPARRVVTAQVQTLDVFATALSLLGLAAPDGLPSRDLVPLWSEPVEPPGRLAYGEGCRPWEVEQLYPGMWPNVGKWQFVLDAPYKLVIAPYLKAGGLYDLDADPGELVDLTRDHPDIVTRLWDELRRWRETTAATELAVDRENLERLRALGYVD
jgi:arylsulfatase A-like enzyme